MPPQRPSNGSAGAVARPGSSPGAPPPRPGAPRPDERIVRLPEVEDFDLDLPPMEEPPDRG
jgi:hypothetical protein